MKDSNSLSERPRQFVETDVVWRGAGQLVGEGEEGERGSVARGKGVEGIGGVGVGVVGAEGAGFLHVGGDPEEDGVHVGYEEGANVFCELVCVEWCCV